MKKVLAFILATVMLISCIPVAFAVEYSELEVEFFDAYCRYSGNSYTLFTKDGKTGEVGRNIAGINEIYENSEKMEIVFSLDYDKGLQYYVQHEPQELEKAVEALKAVNLEVNRWLEENGYRIVIDGYEKGMLDIIFVHYDAETSDEIAEFIEDYTDMEKLEEAADLYYEADALIEKALTDGFDTVTQQEYDAMVRQAAEFIEMGMNCYEGDHYPGQFTDVGGGVHSAECTFCKIGSTVEAHTWGVHLPNDDGKTATAKCEKCEATDTIDVEWVSEPADDNSNFFTMIMATIKDIFERITEFFKKLFG